MHIKFLSSIDHISPHTWNEVVATDFPFIQHAFLSALESSGSVGKSTGWQPHYLVVYTGHAQTEKICAVAPMYIKQHSYGEYVFDHSWAHAYDRCGVPYYPKLVCGIPFTPVTGARICIHPQYKSDENNIYTNILTSIKETIDMHNLSSCHILFPTQNKSAEYIKYFPQRIATHFQWHNKEYQHFTDFLAVFSSRKRKNLKKEREKVKHNNIVMKVLEGEDITQEAWQAFYQFYQMTYLKRSGHNGYLNKVFFDLIYQTMRKSLVLVLAKKDDQYIAGALNFKDSKTLYGRYWGCLQEYDFLHFEACYYQGIEYCINKKLLRFDPGVQGEHKLQRGFEPTYTYSNHYISHPEFKSAIDDFLIKEKSHVQAYYEDSKNYLPFKKTQDII